MSWQEGGNVHSLHSDLYAQESGYWWSAARRKLLLRLLKKMHPSGSDCRYAELGCGGGEFLLLLARAGIKASGLDRSYEACSIAKSKGLCIVNADILRMPFRDKSFNRILAFDILEHLQDEKGGMEAISGVCGDGGIVFFTLPALNCLRTVRDKRLGHYRRYSRRSFERVLQEHKFKPVYSRYMFASLFLPLLFSRFIPSSSEHGEVWTAGGFVNRLFGVYFYLEGILTGLLPMPFGTSLVCIAQKC